MFLGLGVGAFTGAVFHLFTHAFFKALLFLGSGSVMHAIGGDCDITRQGRLYRHIPWTARTFIVGSLALAGIFPFAGFFSKEMILGRPSPAATTSSTPAACSPPPARPSTSRAR